MSNVTEFYRTSGMELVNEANYPPEIHAHLFGEKMTLEQVARSGNYQMALEVGCMDGRLHMQTILSCGMDYLGIDVVPDLISKMNKVRVPQSNGRARAQVMDVCHLVPDAKAAARALAVFPFNSFGNIENPLEALDSVAKCHFDVLILSYATESPSTEIRRTYYSQCGYHNLRAFHDLRGVLFVADEGLNTRAYHPWWVSHHLVSRNFTVQVQRFASAGISYWGRLLHTD